jgi:hypothetical protein
MFSSVLFIPHSLLQSPFCFEIHRLHSECKSNFFLGQSIFCLPYATSLPLLRNMVIHYLFQPHFRICHSVSYRHLRPWDIVTFQWVGLSNPRLLRGCQNFQFYNLFTHARIVDLHNVSKYCITVWHLTWNRFRQPCLFILGPLVTDNWRYNF